MCLGIPGQIIRIDAEEAARTLKILTELGEAQAELEAMQLPDAAE